jgi:hypothetical protein
MSQPPASHPRRHEAGVSGPRQTAAVTDALPTARTTLRTGHVRVLVFCNSCRYQWRRRSKPSPARLVTINNSDAGSGAKTSISLMTVPHEPELVGYS